MIVTIRYIGPSWEGVTVGEYPNAEYVAQGGTVECADEAVAAGFLIQAEHWEPTDDVGRALQERALAAFAERVARRREGFQLPVELARAPEAAGAVRGGNPRAARQNVAPPVVAEAE